MKYGKCPRCRRRRSGGHHHEPVCTFCERLDREFKTIRQNLSELEGRLGTYCIENLTNKPLKQLLEWGKMLEIVLMVNKK
jgi:hypothetical protein